MSGSPARHAQIGPKPRRRAGRGQLLHLAYVGSRMRCLRAQANEELKRLIQEVAQDVVEFLSYVLAHTLGFL